MNGTGCTLVSLLGSTALSMSCHANIVWTDVTRNGHADFNPGSAVVWGGPARVVGDWVGEVKDGGVVVGRTHAIVDSGPLLGDRFASAASCDGWIEPNNSVNMVVTVYDDIEFSVEAMSPVFICATLVATQNTSAWLALQELSGQIIGLPTSGGSFSVSATGNQKDVEERGYLMPGRYRYIAGGGAGASNGTGTASTYSACIVVPAPSNLFLAFVGILPLGCRRRRSRGQSEP